MIGVNVRSTMATMALIGTRDQGRREREGHVRGDAGPALQVLHVRRAASRRDELLRLGLQGRCREFFSPELTERVTDLYGVAPTIDFVEIAQIVDNASS